MLPYRYLEDGNSVELTSPFWKNMHLSGLHCALLLMFTLQPFIYSQASVAVNAVAPSVNNFAYPQSIFVDSPNGHIWVTDFDNHRVMRFDVSILVSINRVEGTTFPADHFLSQNYPNPFNPVTQIFFSVGNTGHTSVAVFNLLGQKITDLFNDVATSNTQYMLTFDAKYLPSGIYWYALRTTQGVVVKRMCLMK